MNLVRGSLRRPITVVDLLPKVGIPIIYVAQLAAEAGNQFF